MLITDIHNPWRDTWQTAYYAVNARAVFYTETFQKGSGRRGVVHEFPKRDEPYSEDMGRRAREFTIIAYLIGPNFKDDRDSLEAQLELLGPGTLQLPTRSTQKVMCLRYQTTEKRIWGGYCEVEMTFVECGEVQLAQTVITNTTQAISTATSAATAAQSSVLDSTLAGP